MYLVLNFKKCKICIVFYVGVVDELFCQFIYCGLENSVIEVYIKVDFEFLLMYIYIY